jgi:hypothetical protein
LHQSDYQQPNGGNNGANTSHHKHVDEYSTVIVQPNPVCPSLQQKSEFRSGFVNGQLPQARAITKRVVCFVNTALEVPICSVFGYACYRS